MHVIANCEQLKTKICDMYAEHQNAIRTGSAQTVSVYVVIMREDEKIVGDIQACRLDEAAPEVSDDQVPIWCDVWFTVPGQWDPDILENTLEFIERLLKNGGIIVQVEWKDEPTEEGRETQLTKERDKLVAEIKKLQARVDEIDDELRSMVLVF